MEFQIVVMMYCFLMREGQNFATHLGIWNKDTEVNRWQTHNPQKRRSYSNILEIL
jgi:uncharacterized membrane protein YoaT (DUF817 family)